MAEQDWSQLDSVKTHVPRALSFAESYLEEELKSITTEAESPIEAIFALWWYVMAGLRPRFNHRMKLHHQFGFAPINGKSYRPDFAVWPANLDLVDAELSGGARFRAVVIELDGHDFHERTKDQVAERNERDRNLQDAGYLVLHYSGSEIHREPERVITTALDAAEKEWATFVEKINKVRPYLD